ncbi:RRXRR domain-containing protein [Cupriavidus sp. D39]|uniref:RRXRR domain-containing protein n=1 Tax=Cupriavidus sp. D39 TaxID=2997877 RepID=UPI00226DADEB|nr:RRXRR domain-containing protein [Cupriavidus sp. D39]MCY0858773.1 RRXRR domain-containing protein [Cupriavidus sp. D39]
MPFAIRLVDLRQSNCRLQAVRLKLDTGTKAIGVAIVRDVESDTTGSAHHVAILSLAELIHLGMQFSLSLTASWAMRGARRGRMRTIAQLASTTVASQSAGWHTQPAAPRRHEDGMGAQIPGALAPITAISTELVRFDIAGDARPRRVTPREIEHIVARAAGGSDRALNLTLASVLNRKKAARTLAEFLCKDPERLQRILARAKAPLPDARPSI